MTNDQELEAYRAAFARPGLLVFLDGRNEFGTHILPMLPCNVSDKVVQFLFQEDGPNEDIMKEAEALGFVAGDCVWIEWQYHPAQTGEYGRVEIPDVWEFAGINVEASGLFAPQPSTTLPMGMQSYVDEFGSTVIHDGRPIEEERL